MIYKNMIFNEDGSFARFRCTIIPISPKEASYFNGNNCKSIELNMGIHEYISMSIHHSPKFLSYHWYK